MESRKWEKTAMIRRTGRLWDRGFGFYATACGRGRGGGREGGRVERVINKTASNLNE